MSVENAKSTFARAQPHPIFWMRQSKPVMSVDAEPGVSAQAVLSEIEEYALRFAATGEEASIDLRCLKAVPDEREMLESLLGRGEVSAVLDALGCSEIHETAIPCVWWVRHRKGDEEVVGETIEIAEVPEVLMGDRSAVASGLQALRNASPFLMRRLRNIATQTNGHGNRATLDNEARHAHPPLLNPLDGATSHSTKLQKTAAKSLVIPQAGEEADESLREFKINER